MELNEPEGQLSLAGWYMTGAEGILEQDHKKAFTLAKLASNQKLPRAQYTLGYFFESGVGVPKSDSDAIFHYRLAAQNGEERAVKRLQELGLIPSIKSNQPMETKKQKKKGILSMFMKSHPEL